MQPEELPPNTRTSKPAISPKKGEKPEKKVEKIVTDETVIQRKTPLGKKLKELFIGDDARSVGHYVFVDVIIPATKDLLHDIVIQAVERTLFGTSRASSRRADTRPSGPLGHIQYNRMSGNHRDDRPTMSRRARATHDFQEIVLTKRVEAEAVIDQLFALISQYNEATVGDLYDMVGIDSTFADQKWGWTDLRGADVVRVRNGYLLDLPRPVALD